MDLIPGLPYDMGLECLVRVPYHHFSSVSSVCRTWTRQIHLPDFWRLRKSSGLTRRVLVLAQARVDPTRESAPKKDAAAPVYRLTACEPETGAWAELPPVPGGLPLFCQLAGVGSTLVVVGGLDPATWAASSRVFLYDFLSGEWRRGADMSGPRRLFFACAADPDSRTVFVAGGHDCEKRALKSAMAYDVAGDEWAPLADMAAERDEPRGAWAQGRFHVVGGYPTSAQGRFGADSEAFDKAAGEWGPIEEGFLGLNINNINIGGGEGEMAVAWEGGVAVRGEYGCGGWRVAAAAEEVPVEARKAAHVEAWGSGKVLVMGKKAFLLDVKRGKWERLLLDFSGLGLGHVQSGCSLEL